jgi:peroxiredoxin
MNRFQFLVALLAMGALALSPISAYGQAPKKGSRKQAAVGKEPPHPPKVGEAAPDFELADLDGNTVSLKTLAAEKPVVLLVLRGWPGYQCPICSRQVGDFLAKKGELDKHGAAIVLVYPGPADSLTDRAKEFEDQGKWELPANFHYVTDPDYKFTDAWGLRWEAARETAYPSTFIIGKDQKIKFAKTSTTHGDRAAAATVLEELAKLK